MTLENRVAVITGATGGLGRVVTERFAAQGARLALVSTNIDHLQSLAKELSLREDRVLLFKSNAAEGSAMKSLADAVMKKFGRADILLHLVGGYAGGKPVSEVTAEEVEKMLAQHLWGTLFLLQAVAPHLIANNWGRVIVVSSPYAVRPPGKHAPYAIAKAAQEALMLSLAQEVKGTGVTANVLVVSAIDTQYERDRERTPKNASWTTPEEIAEAILFLCSHQAQMINGARIPLYGSP